MEYPDHCIRGILNSTFLLEDDMLTLGAFDFRKGERDDWKEASINWMDDEYAIDFTLKQTKVSGELKFEAGIAILPRSELDKIKKDFKFIGYFDYERKKAEEDNKYHGNLLLSDKISKYKRDVIRNLLVFAAKVVKRGDNSTCGQQPFISEI